MTRRSIAICATLLLTSSLSFAQSGGGGSGGGGSGGGSGGGGFGGGGSGGGGGQNSANSGGLSNQSLNLLGSSSGTPGIATSSSLNASNPFSRTVGNPLYAGRVGSTVESAPGGFGTPTYPATAAGRTGGTGAVSVGGRTGGATGGSSTATSFTPSTPNTAIRVRYTAGLKFPTRAVAGNELQGQLREVLDRSGSLSAAGKVEVVVEDRVVILRGSAADDDERKLIEGMLRMTPGVREIRNELRIP